MSTDQNKDTLLIASAASLKIIMLQNTFDKRQDCAVLSEQKKKTGVEPRSFCFLFKRKVNNRSQIRKSVPVPFTTICEAVTYTTYLSQRDVPCPVGCWDDRLLNDKVAPFVWPQPLQFPLAAAAPRFPHDLLPPYPGCAHCNQGARCQWLGPFWRVESVCCPAGRSYPQQDLI